jgi:EF-P beta-lysylation protein EpmB
LSTWQSQSWQQQLADTVRDPAELCRLLQLDPEAFAAVHLPANTPLLQNFPLRVPRGFVERMRPGDLHDPLLLQVLPQTQEALDRLGFSIDPLQEKQASPHPGLIHKYHGRVLMMLTGACAIHCRYCFRRHFPYNQHRLNREQWQQNLNYLREQPSINEVIYSGGDPLALGDEHLHWLTEEIAGIAHIDTLRIHTRLPVVIPDRIDPACLSWLDQARLKIVLVIHCNHPNEISAGLARAVSELRARDIVVLNQAVLLKSVNDNVESLLGLSKNLFKIGVLPYYLHLLDRVAGAHHFEVDDLRAKQLHARLKDQLPGYLVPKLVKEVPEAGAKQVLG